MSRCLVAGAFSPNHIDSSKDSLESIGQEHSRVNFSFDSKLALTDGGLYGLDPDGNNLHIFRLSKDDNIFIPVQGIPTFDGEKLSIELWTTIAKAERIDLPDNMEKNTELTKALRGIATLVIAGGFVVDDETFYVEYQRRLFKWKPGDPEWINTGLIDHGKQSSEDLRKGFKLMEWGSISL